VRVSYALGGRGREIWKIFPDVTYCGKEFPRQFQFRATKHTSSLEFTQEYAELNMLIDAIVPIGVSPVDIARVAAAESPTPDFVIRSESGGTIFVECTRAGDREMMRTWDTVHLMEAALNEWLASNTVATRAMAGHFLTIVPERLPKAAYEKAFVDEIRRLVLNGDPSLTARTFIPVPVQYKIMASCGTTMAVSASVVSGIFIQFPMIGPSSPNDSSKLLLERLECKQKNRYEGFRPLWLVIGAHDLRRPFRGPVDRLRRSVQSIAPFAAVIICNSEEIALMQAVEDGAEPDGESD
jgi:hypothetical protein